MLQRKRIQARIAKHLAQLKEKLDVLTGFGDDISKIRTVIQMLKFYDKSNTGYITIEQFYEFMLRFNFVAVNKEIEEIFNRFDEDMTGYADYREIAYGLYDRASFVTLPVDAQRIMESLRHLMQQKSVYAPMSLCQLARDLPGMNQQGEVPLRSTLDQLHGLLSNRIHKGDLSKLLQEFDIHRNHHVNIPMFLRSFKVKTHSLFSLNILINANYL